jgi:hypothetical protein
MAEVVMDDMAIGNPASLWAHLWRFWASFPGIHIAQFRFSSNWQLWRNFPGAMQQRRRSKALASAGGVPVEN